MSAQHLGDRVIIRASDLMLLRNAAKSWLMANIDSFNAPFVAKALEESDYPPCEICGIRQKDNETRGIYYVDRNAFKCMNCFNAATQDNLPGTPPSPA